MMHKIMTIGHRGAKGHFPENTLLSFRKSLEMNADGIELDVHLSADNEIIVMHDHSIDRTTNGKGAVKDLSLAALKNFRIDVSESIPTLNEVFDLIDKKCLINIELKVATAAKPVTAIIEKYVAKKDWKYEHFIVSSFDWNALQEISNWNPKIPLGVLTETNLELAIGFSEYIKAATIHPYFHLITAENVAQMQAKGFGVFPWTINEPEDIDRIKSFNVNGIITDFPDSI
ncbi:MAG: glycerophosphodiester phosphodiesterase family protein [Flavobacterium sp.]|nr:glycerophosphodiester phosphodiesterase family protein [Flavobacterium sp.]